MSAPMTGPIAPGPANCITDVPGIRVGQAEEPALLTGATAVVPEAPAAAAVDIRGGAPGTRATEGLLPGGAVEGLDAVVLSGGSAFGLDAAGGAMEALRAAGRGYAVGPVRVPIVAAAILFDLLTGEGADWETPPWRRLGRLAAEDALRALRPVRLGNAGAGLGATAGALKGGVGTASFRMGDVTVGALAVANPLGSVVMPGTRTFWGWWLEQAGELGHQAPPDAPPASLDHAFPWETRAGANTTLAVVATDADLPREDCLRVAIMAQDGLARAIRPAHAPLDGDVVFALSTGRVAPGERLSDVSRIGMLAADCAARAIMRGVYEAEGAGGVAGYREGG
jgi:L-aminopeptidase/D-esterase-like protein